MSFQNPTVAGAADSANLIHTLLVDPSGNLLVNVAAGGTSGTQYADGTTQATPTGTVAIGKNPTNILHALSLDASGNLNVNLAAGTISGGNAAASPTGAAVPASADYLGVNIAGNLVGVTGVSLTNAKAATVAIVDGNGNQITSFGGGTQFADNAASGATPTGTLSMGWDSALSKVRALKVDASQNLNVNLAANSFGTLTVSGTVSVTNFANPLPVSQSGTWTVQPGNTANTTPWLATINQGGNSAAVTATNALKVDGSAVTQPVSGTLTANQGGAPWSQNMTQVGGSAIAIGQAAMAASLPVAIASNQTAIKVFGTNTNNVDFPGIDHVSVLSAVASAAAKTWVEGFEVELSVDLSGNLRTVTTGTVTANQGGAPWSVVFPSAQAVTLPTGQAVELLDSGGVNKASISAAGAVSTSNATIAANGSNPAPTSSTQVGFLNNFNGNFVSLSGFVSGGVNALATVLVDGGGVLLPIGDNTTPPDVVPVGFGAMGYDPIANKVRALTVDTSQNLKVSVSSLPLPSNAAQETGNLATLVTQTRNATQIVDVLSQILAQVKYNNLLLASSSTSDLDDSDTVVATLIQ